MRKLNALLPLFLALICVSFSTQAEAPKALTPQATREAFLKIIDRPRVPLEYTETVVPTDEPIERVNFSYQSEATQRVPGILFRPREKTAAKRPVVIVAHGTGGNKEQQVALLQTLAKRGFVAIAIDGRYHGERGTQADYNHAIATAFKAGGAHPLYFDTVWDLMRLLDVIQTRPSVDGSRIGLMGFSKGGIETWLMAAIDERITVAIPTIGVQSFKYGLESGDWKARVGTVKKAYDDAAATAGVTDPDATFTKQFYDKLLPGITAEFDGPQMLPLIAPRALLVIQGDTDKLNPLPGLKLCTDAATAAYEKASVSEKFQFIIQPKTGHNVTPASRAKAVDWFAKWLKP